ncbi:MAG: SDR family oxidoreductase [Chloroflexi bacterium]|nr:MAG: SDR family oxidoreductase [Chloroflexota bacterium]
MRILVLGGSGMLGHKLWQACQNRFDTWVTIRSTYNNYARYNLFDAERTWGGVDVLNFDTMVRAFATVQPDVVINCVGIIKQLPSAKDPLVSLSINSLFPHRLANLCTAAGAKLIHISTDCVFSGRKGMYTEDDVSDAEDLYGRSKYLGEISQVPHLTLRTSIIGRELQMQSGLVEWFLSNRGGEVRGYTNAIYSGFTTLALAEIITQVIERHLDLTGLYHVSSAPISKNDLLCLIRDIFDLSIDIDPDPTVHIDRSLDSSRFWSIVDFSPPSWPKMIQDMAADTTPYDNWRNIHAS